MGPCPGAVAAGNRPTSYQRAPAVIEAQTQTEAHMQRWECYRDMMAGLLDGMRDGLSGAPRSSNANRSHSYAFAYGDGYTSASTLKAKPRDPIGEELAFKADMEMNRPQ